MAGGQPGGTLYHRRESPTQTPADAARQEASGEIWGQPPLDKVHNGGILLDSLNSVMKSENDVYRITMRFSASTAAQDCQARLNLALGSHIPKVKAYPGSLPVGVRGIEFVTDVPPDAGGSPGRPEWSGPRPGVVVQGGYAKIRVIVTRNTQK